MPGFRTSIIAAGLAAVVTTGGYAYAQGPGWHGGGWGAGPGWHGGASSPINAEDRAARIDARIAGLKALLRLTPEQERHWPPFEAAMREAAQARFQRMQAFRDTRDRDARPDAVTRMRARADAMAAGAAELRKVADAAQPLYASLSEGQRRRIDDRLSRGMGGQRGGQRL